jgi:gliding motility-associated-like protein
MRFISNEGQWPKEVTHRAELPGAFVWMERGAVVIDRYDAELVAKAHANIAFDPTKEIGGSLRHHALRLRFLSATLEARTSSRLLLPGRYNYFLGNDPSHWGHNSRAYAEVTLHSVAPGCDAVFREGRTGLKYDLVLSPGSDPAGIRFTYEGAEKMLLRDGALLVNTSLGRLVERIPLAYQEVNGERTPVSCTYVLTDGVVGVKPGPYDPALPLIIDPTLSFATFSGSVSNNFGYTATFDNAGFLYAGSTAFGNEYPTTMGAYSTTWAGGTTDIAITKYDTTGTFLVWSTYLGGNAAEMPHSLIVDGNDQLHVLGTTASANFPTSTSAFDNSFAGGTAFTPAGLGLSYPNGSDMILAKLSADGSQLLASTLLGGSGNDGLNSAPALKFNYADEVRGEVLLDPLGNVWVVSCTQSTNMPVTPAAAQPSFGGGSHDGYVARFDPFLSQLQYASYIGGSNADATYAGELDPSGRLYVCGGSSSADLPISSGAVNPAFNGGAADCFVARFEASGNAIDRLTYWGSSAYDQAYFVELDGPGSVYLFGQTSAPAGQLIFNAPYNVPSGGQFITKMSADLDVVQISSRVGSGDGTPDISPTAFLVDVCDKIYTSGWGSSAGGLGGQLTTAGLPVTPSAIQTTTTGHDLYLAVFDIDMTALDYATYYGGPTSPEHVDGGTSRFDRRGRVYQSVCAGCQGNSDFPTTPGAWSATNNSGGCNNGVVKLDFDSPLVIANFSAPDTACAGSTIPFTNLSGGATGHQWDFGDGGSSSAVSPTHTYASPGVYTVTLVADNPLTCNGTDAVSRTVRVEDAAPSIIAMNDTLLCGPLDGFMLVANSFGTTDNFTWSSSASFTDVLNASQQDSTAFISPALSGTYHVRGGTVPACRTTDSVTVTVSLAQVAVVGDSLVCSGDTAMLQVLGADAGSTILWEPNVEILEGQGTPTASVAPLETTGYGVGITSPEGCSWNGTIIVSVSSIASGSVGASVDQNIVSPGTVVTLTATPGSGVSYDWSPAELVSDPSSATPTATVESTTTFVVTVSDGICSKSDSVTVTVYDAVCGEPDIFVPNSFTPNNDGANDRLFVRGRNITELEFLVFDRWGEKVFETNDLNIGWDGTFKGEEVGPAVFVYHLTAKCLDGQEYFTKGNVTVIR